ncbi:MAG: transcriptional repressor [Paludibacteraceae bacterium]|nr:transcriptional repressor [Paludibacteraceae bacterium]
MKRAALNSALERLNRYVLANNKRPSKVRNIVLEQAFLLPQPFVADQLVEACQAQRISVGTVYNSLEIFVSARILHSITRQRGQNATYYEWIVGEQTRLQVVCEKCGRVSDFHDKAIERLIQERRYSNFNMHHFSLYVYGECKLCKKTKKLKES